MSSYLYKDQKFLTDFNGEDSFNAGKKSLDYPNISRIATSGGGSTIRITSISDFINSTDKNIENVERYDYIYSDGEGNLYRSQQDQNIKAAMVEAGYVVVGICLLTPSADNGVGKMISIDTFQTGAIDPTNEETDFITQNCMYSANKSGKQLTYEHYTNWVNHGSKTKDWPYQIGSWPFTATSVFSQAYNYEIGGLPKGTWYVPSIREVNAMFNNIDTFLMKYESSGNSDYRQVMTSDYMEMVNCPNPNNDGVSLPVVHIYKWSAAMFGYTESLKIQEYDYIASGWPSTANYIPNI